MTFLRSTAPQDRLTACTMLSVGNVMAENIMNFNENVTDKSANHKKGERNCYTNKTENIAIVTE